MAINIFPALLPAFFSASMKGVSTATLFFITLALFTTCGKNIFPNPNKSPMMFIPSIRGPSITSNGFGSFCLASSVSASINSVIPLINACFSLSSTAPCLHSPCPLSLVPCPLSLTVSANAINFSVAWFSSLFLFNITSSQSSRSVGSISSYTTNCPAFTIPMSIPALMA